MKCLASLTPTVPFELVVFANGLPLSQEIREALSAMPAPVKFGESSVELSPGAARNRALELVTTEWVHLLDDDSFWCAGYWETIRALLERSDAQVIGGPDSPAQGMNFFQVSVAIALSSPLCTGVTFARHRSLGKGISTATEERLTSCNLWVKTELLRKHPFPEDFYRAEETVLLLALQEEGTRMLYVPALRVGHHRRKNLLALLRPTIGAGYWRSRLLRMRKESLSIFALPSIFVLLHLLLFTHPDIFWELARVYGIVVLAASAGLSSQRRGLRYFPLVAFLHYFIVFFYGAGFLLERLGYRWKK